MLSDQWHGLFHGVDLRQEILEKKSSFWRMPIKISQTEDNKFSANPANPAYSASRGPQMEA